MGATQLDESPPAADMDAPAERASGVAARLASYRVIYVSVIVFALLYVFSVIAAERMLEATMQQRVAEALEITDFNESVALQIQRRIDERVRRSPWVRWGGVRVNVLVIGKDGRTLIYAGGPVVPPPSGPDLLAHVHEAERLLPATAQVSVTLPHNTLLSNAILLLYAGALIQWLYLYNRGIARREQAELQGALGARDTAAARAGEIEQELDAVRERLATVVPTEREHAQEIRDLERERERLRAQLAALSTREEELRGRAERAVELDEERRTLEELLEEATTDLASRDEAIQDLEQRLHKADRGAKKSSHTRSRDAENLHRRLRTLYKNLEIDERAFEDIVALGDEALRLKCEENLKRLDSEADNVAVRRKVGGLPRHLSVFELGFAGKGRIYYTKGVQRRFRIRLVGGKASQRADLEYLSRLD